MNDIRIADMLTLDDPYPAYRALRSREPVLRTGPGLWVLSRYDDVKRAQSDRRFRADLRAWSGYVEFAEAFWGGIDSPIAALQRDVFLFQDGPHHLALRATVSRAFRPRAIEAMTRGVEAKVDQLLRGEAIDVVTDLALPLSTSVISDLLGIPPADREACLARARRISPAFGPPPPPEERGDVERAIEDGCAYFERLAAMRRQRPEDDLLSQLATSQIDGDLLSMRDVVASALLLFDAGHETTAALIGNGVACLAERRDQFELVRDDPNLVPLAVEEMLRFDPPFQVMRKVTAEPIELSSGTVPADAVVLGLIGAANRDPEAFPDPDRFEIRRTGSVPLSFGHGAHFCLGAGLARLQARTVVARLASLAQSLTLAEPPVRGGPGAVRGYASVRIEIR